jgi:hypothetical protein
MLLELMADDMYLQKKMMNKMSFQTRPDDRALVRLSTGSRKGADRG